ncbi:MAG: hypothetical protein AAF297_11440 [Planctomycetota bacterium]
MPSNVRFAAVPGMSVLCIASVAAAGPVFSEAEMASLDRVGFENADVGAAVISLDFGNVAATVSQTGGEINRIYRQHDGHGAVSGEGELFWKLLGGRTDIDFGGVELEAFGFWYSDLEWDTLRITAGESVFDLVDSNSRNPKWFEIESTPGQTFSMVSLEFFGPRRDGVGFDGLTARVATIPSPTPAAALAVAGVLVAGRRRG